MMEGAAELVDALVCAGAQMECASLGSGTAWSTHHLESTPLLGAACVARYDSVQELVWQGASLKAPCTAKANPVWLEETKAGSSCHDAELAAVLHPSTYKWVHVFLCSQCAFPALHRSLTFHMVLAGCYKTLMVRRQTTPLMGLALPSCARPPTT